MLGCAKKRHEIIPNRLAFDTVRERETGGHRRNREVNQEDPTHAHLHHWK